jgi:hypothetical protein
MGVLVVADAVDASDECAIDAASHLPILPLRRQDLNGGGCVAVAAGGADDLGRIPKRLLIIISTHFCRWGLYANENVSQL